VARVSFLLAFLLVFVTALVAQPPRRPPQPPVVEEPQEEDESAKPKEYTLNPLQAEKELRIGNYYAKKNSFKAAAARYQEATLWNPASSEAFLKLAEARERLSDWKAAKLAYEKYLELEPDSKSAPAIKKKLELLAASTSKRK
jgi:tetratricopeptide (TPR) repeat protein